MDWIKLKKRQVKPPYIPEFSIHEEEMRRDRDQHMNQINEEDDYHRDNSNAMPGEQPVHASDNSLNLPNIDD